MSTGALVFGAIAVIFGCIAVVVMVGASVVVDRANDAADNALAERDLARKARNDAEAALVWARVTTAVLQARADIAAGRREGFDRDLRVIRSLPEVDER